MSTLGVIIPLRLSLRFDYSVRQFKACYHVQTGKTLVANQPKSCFYRMNRSLLLNKYFFTCDLPKHTYAKSLTSVSTHVLNAIFEESSKLLEKLRFHLTSMNTLYYRKGKTLYGKIISIAATIDFFVLRILLCHYLELALSLQLILKY